MISLRKNNINFGRAFTTLEKKEYKATVQQAQKELGIENSAMIIFPSMFPSSKDADTGVGSSVSKDAKDFLNWSKDMFNFNAVQLGPESSLLIKFGADKPDCHPNPYTGSAFSMGEHVIDINSLVDAGLISKDDLKTYFINPDLNDKKFNNDYGNFAKSIKPILKTAYDNFKKLPENNNIKKEYKKFLEKNDPETGKTGNWLESDAIFSVLEKKYNTNVFFQWEDIDKKLNKYLSFDKNTPEYKIAEKRIQEIKQESKEEIELYKFTQFLLHNHKENMYDFANKNGIKLIGDSPIGFNKRDVWRKPNAFIMHEDMNGQFTKVGVPEEEWSSLALKPNEDGIKLLKEKIRKILEYNHGIRLDAFFEYVNPYYYHHYQDNESTEKDYIIGDKFVSKIMEVSQEYKDNPKIIIAENLPSFGLDGKPSKEVLKKYNIPEIKMSRWTQASECSERDWIAPGNHDMESLIVHTKEDKNKQKEILTNLYMGSIGNGQGPKNIQLTCTDVMGMSERINDNPGKAGDWMKRMPYDYEKFYHQQVMNGFGLNLPEILANTLHQKNKDKNLIDKLQTFAGILQENLGDSTPLTTEEAEKYYNAKNSRILLNA